MPYVFCVNSIKKRSVGCEPIGDGTLEVGGMFVGVFFGKTGICCGIG